MKIYNKFSFGGTAPAPNASNPKVKTRRYDDAFILPRAESYWNKNKPLIENKNRSSETHMPNKDG